MKQIAVLDYPSDGDAFVVTRLDRLVYSTAVPPSLRLLPDAHFLSYPNELFLTRYHYTPRTLSGVTGGVIEGWLVRRQSRERVRVIARLMTKPFISEFSAYYQRYLATSVSA